MNSVVLFLGPPTSMLAVGRVPMFNLLQNWQNSSSAYGMQYPLMDTHVYDLSSVNSLCESKQLLNESTSEVSERNKERMCVMSCLLLFQSCIDLDNEIFSKLKVCDYDYTTGFNTSFMWQDHYMNK